VLKHLRDIESDMSAIHGIHNIWAMDGPRFFAFAYRLPAYKGIMRALAESQAAREDKRTGGREIVPVGSGELNKIEGLGATRNLGDGTPWLSIEKATD
jgi:hypothetical protein